MVIVEKNVRGERKLSKREKKKPDQVALWGNGSLLDRSCNSRKVRLGGVPVKQLGTQAPVYFTAY